MLCLTLGTSFGWWSAEPTAEYQVKAVFVYKLATYIRWPGTPGETNRPFVIAIVGRDPFGGAIDTAVKGETIDGREIVVRRPAVSEDLTRCDVLFISGSERASVPKILSVVASAPVLTIADMDGFTESGGMITLKAVDRHIRFEINLRALDHAGLKAPAQLLSLAKVVGEPRR